MSRAGTPPTGFAHRVCYDKLDLRHVDSRIEPNTHCLVVLKLCKEETAGLGLQA